LIFLQTGTTDLQILLTTGFSERLKIFLWIISIASFSIEVPVIPVHIWLSDSEPSAAECIILAGIPLKLGTYGFLRFSIPMFPEETLCSPFNMTRKGGLHVSVSCTVPCCPNLTGYGIKSFYELTFCYQLQRIYCPLVGYYGYCTLHFLFLILKIIPLFPTP